LIWVTSFVIAAAIRTPVALAVGVMLFLCSPFAVLAIYLRTPIRPPRRRVGGLKMSTDLPRFPRIRTWG
jgi:drug/metabolite transporter (DMT)-like permease